jgi:hypothetical protein
MMPVSFPQQTMVWAKDQPPYRPLPAYTDDNETVTCWRMTWWERLLILCSGTLWLRQLNFGAPLQPQHPQAVSPFRRNYHGGQ